MTVRRSLAVTRPTPITVLYPPWVSLAKRTMLEGESWDDGEATARSIADYTPCFLHGQTSKVVCQINTEK